ncbi:MAG TPA: ROK family protein [Candidatus Limnocylindrales bacterium]|nr:ROK family protein [Candidatus Limnocylindrales bacterium]
MLEFPPDPEALRGVVLTQRPVLGLDLGGTQIRAAIVLPDGQRLARIADDTRSHDGPDAVVARCLRALEAARDAAPREVADALVGIGISSPGPVDPFAGVVVDPPNLGPDFHDVPLAARVEQALGLPTFLGRDTVVAALAEWAYGAAAGCDDFLYVTVSTGIGGAVVSDGRLLSGPDGTAGELGHVTVDMDGPACGCGGAGHLEAVSSGRAIARDARAAAARGESPFLAARAAALPEGVEGLGARDVAAGEEAADAASIAIMARVRRAFAAAAVAWVDLFDPARVIIGGSIAESQGDRLLGPAREAIARDAFRAPARRVTLVHPELGADVSLAGAHPLVSRRLQEDATRSVRTALVPESVPA